MSETRQDHLRRIAYLEAKASLLYLQWKAILEYQPTGPAVGYGEADPQKEAWMAEEHRLVRERDRADKEILDLKKSMRPITARERQEMASVRCALNPEPGEVPDLNLGREEEHHKKGGSDHADARRIRT